MQPDLIWTRPAWRAEADAWIAEELDRLGVAPTGPTEQPHIRPWSTVLRVPTADGDLYFKASAPVQAFEVPLLSLLADGFADRLPSVVAADVGRAWMLMRDGGTPLRLVVRRPRDLEHWVKVVPLYAELQVDAAAHADDLLRIGVPDLRLEELPSRFEELVERADVTTVERLALRARLPRLAALCDELGDDGIAPSIQHNDLHENNVLLRDGRYRLFDWGDSSVSHPFQSMRTTLVFAAHAVGLSSGSEALGRIRDAYLEPWSAAASAGTLLRSFRIALVVGGVSDVLTEDRHVRAAGLEPAPADPRSIASMLRALLDEL